MVTGKKVFPCTNCVLISQSSSDEHADKVGGGVRGRCLKSYREQTQEKLLSKIRSKCIMELGFLLASTGLLRSALSFAISFLSLIHH